MEALPFKCPAASEEDHADHVLAPVSGDIEPFVPGQETNPFVRFRALLSAHQICMEEGGSDQSFIDMAERLNERIAIVDGAGFGVTPLLALDEPTCLDMGLENTELWVKNETGNVSGSHKARHLMSVMLYLLSLEARSAWLGSGLRQRRLAIASCGNAALGAAVIARAADWPLDVFVPPDAAESVVARLRDLDAAVHTCRRVENFEGDPCYKAFQAEVASGSLPFGVQGPDNGLAIEGSRVLGFELAQQLGEAGAELDALFIQVGGGGLASGTWAGLKEAQRLGFHGKIPAIYTVQTRGAHPLRKAFEEVQRELGGLVLNPETIDQAVQHAAEYRHHYMKPWPEEPKSIAHGILDDETYDWLALVRAMLETRGDALVVPDSRIEDAYFVGRKATEIPVSYTGVSGLAGLLDLHAHGKAEKIRTAGVLFTAR